MSETWKCCNFRNSAKNYKPEKIAKLQEGGGLLDGLRELDTSCHFERDGREVPRGAPRRGRVPLRHCDVPPHASGRVNELGQAIVF